MAANLQSRGLVNLGKRVVNQISYASARTTANSPSLSGSSVVDEFAGQTMFGVHDAPFFLQSPLSLILILLSVSVEQEITDHSMRDLRRGVQTSVYDKNPEEHVRDSFVPDEVIEAQSEKYWAPHPQTGVFGPASTDTAGGERGSHSSPATAAAAESILEQKTFFRPLEDLEKPMLN